MTAERWQAFERYAAWVRGKPTWDAEEREPRLEVAGTLREAVAAASAHGGWQELLAECLYRPEYRRADLTLRGQDEWLWPWLVSGDPGLREAVAAFGRLEPSPEERFAAFAAAAGSAQAAGKVPGAPGSVMAFASLLNFAVEPKRLPFVQRSPFRRLERLLDGHPAEAGSPTEEYAAHLDFAARLQARLREAGLDADMLDVTALILSAARNAAFWTTGAGVGPDTAPLRRAAPHYLAVCAIYRDEASYMREWIEFHRLVGVERFFLYDNNSTDDHREVLAPYLERDEVVIHPWPMDQGQTEAYEHCIAEYGTDARWIAFIDLDEFLFSPTGRPLPQVLSDYERWPAVGVNWAVFGTSGHLTRPAGLVIESYLDRLQTFESHGIKTVADPARVAPGGARVHRFELAESGTVDENQYPMALGFTKTVSRARLQLNHYRTKSLEEYRMRSLRARPAPAGLGETRAFRRPFDPEQLRQRERHVERDEAILRYLPALREALARSRA
jgi:hypothetical protein